MVEIKYLFVLQVVLIGCIISANLASGQSVHPGRNDLSSKNEIEIIESDENSNELNDGSDEEDEYVKLYRTYLKRALPRMGRSYGFDQDDEVYKRALMRMGRALPRMGRALPRMGRALPRMG